MSVFTNSFQASSTLAPPAFAPGVLEVAEPLASPAGPSLADTLASLHPEGRSMVNRMMKAQENLVDHLHVLNLPEKHLVVYAQRVVETVADGENIRLDPAQSNVAAAAWLNQVAANQRVHTRDRFVCLSAAQRLEEAAKPVEAGAHA